MSVEVKGYIVPDDDQAIYDYFGIGATSPQIIRQAIAEANGSPLDVEISTCYGGDVFSGSTMYSLLRGYQGGANIHITGLAASAASVIAMGGKSDMSPTAMLMVHKVSSIAMGNHHAMDTESASLQSADRAIAAAYEAKSGMSEKDALKLMDAETWITAKQAVDLGLVDSVSDAAAPAQLINAAIGMPLPRAVIEKTRAMLAQQRGAAEKPVPKAEEPAEPDAQAVTIARAKLNMIEKTYLN